MENVKVTLVKSLIACKPNQIATAKSLGLTKIGNSIVCKNDQVLAGKIKVISHLVKVEVQVLVTVKQQVKDTKAKMRVQAAELDQALKAVNFHYTENFLKEDLTINLQRFMQLSTLAI